MSPVSLFRVSKRRRRRLRWEEEEDKREDLSCSAFFPISLSVSLSAFRPALATGSRVVGRALVLRIFDCAATSVRLVSGNLDLIRRRSRFDLHYLIDPSLINASRLFNFTGAS